MGSKLPPPSGYIVDNPNDHQFIYNVYIVIGECAWRCIVGLYQCLYYIYPYLAQNSFSISQPILSIGQIYITSEGH